MVMSSAVVFAVKRAIESARKDAGNDDLVILCKHVHLFCDSDDGKCILFQLLQ